jgi:hypothetical protein
MVAFTEACRQNLTHNQLPHQYDGPDMADNKRLRKQLASLEARIEEHKAKIRDELDKPLPSWGDIQHWASECKTWQYQVLVIRAKLPIRS